MSIAHSISSFLLNGDDENWRNTIIYSNQFKCYKATEILLPNRYIMYTGFETYWKSLLAMCATKRCHPKGPNHNLVAHDLHIHFLKQWKHRMIYTVESSLFVGVS